jgi:hypothetical protein
VSTILCSELLDTIPGAGNSNRPFDDDSFRTLVDALDRLTRHSVEVQRAASTSTSASSAARCDVYFTFEQRGVLSLGPHGLLDSHLLQPLRQHGFVITHITGVPYQPGNGLVALHMVRE